MENLGNNIDFEFIDSGKTHSLTCDCSQCNNLNGEFEDEFIFDTIKNIFSGNSNHLNEDQIQSAINYNRRQKNRVGWNSYYNDIVQKVLKLNYSPDERNFVLAVADWQANNGYYGRNIDGKIGPSTWRKMQSILNSSTSGVSPSNSTTAISNVGSWLHFSRMRTRQNRSAWLQRIRDVKLTDVYLVVNWGSTNFYISGGNSAVRQLEDIIKSIQEIGVNVHLMTFMHSSITFVRDCSNFMIPFMHKTNAKSLLLDVEGYWISGRSKSISEINRVVSYFNDTFKSANFQLGVTSYGYLPTKVKPLAQSPLVDYVIPQAYSAYNPRKGETPANCSSHKNPGRVQSGSFRSWNITGKKIIMGLASYRICRPNNISVHEAMKRDLNATISLGVKEVAYWQLIELFRTSSSSRGMKSFISRIR